jgi:ABC-type nitrate/sulfonate/bicarbonate transport system substrate-binding protein
MKTLVAALIFFSMSMPLPGEANPYLAKPGETPAAVRVAACAITGGFIHLYAALDYGLFDKYGVKVEFVSIRGSGVALAALAAD